MTNHTHATRTRPDSRAARTAILSACAAALVLALAPCATAQTAAGAAESSAAQKSPAAQQPVAGPAEKGSAPGRSRRARAKASELPAKEAGAAESNGAAKTADESKAARESKPTGELKTAGDAKAADAAGAKGEAANRVEPAGEGEGAAAVAGEEKNVRTGKDADAKKDADAAGPDSETREGGDDLRARIESAKTDAERARLRRELAERLAAEGHRGEAVAELRALLAQGHFDPAGYYNVGNALARLDESSAAVEAYRKAIGQRRGNYSRAQHNLGVVLVRLGRWEEALDALQSALRLEGGRYPEASYNLGRLHALRGEAGLAIDSWTRTLTQQPEHADAAVALARALAEDGDPERGLAVLDAFAKRFHTRATSAPRAVEVARGEIIAARNLAELGGGGRVASSGASSSRRAGETLRALAVDQQTYDLLRRARTAREGGQHEEAVALYRRVIERRGGYFTPANLELGYSLTNLRRDPEATAALELVAEREGARYPVAFYHLGRLYERAGQTERSVEAFARAAALYGDGNPQVLLDLSRARERAGDVRGAADAMDAYVRATSRLGAAPDWAREHLSKLRQKTDAAPQPK